MAAQVAWVNESNGRVHINGGEIDGYTLGAIVCFYVSTRETLVCGIVQTASPSTAVVKVEKKWGKRIVKRTEAMLYVEEDEEMKQEDKKEAKEEDKEEMKENEDRFR